MSGFLSEDSLSLNQIEQALRARRGQGLDLIDFTDTNPTHQGLLFPAEILRHEADRYFSQRWYDPDGRGLPEARQAVAGYYRKRGETQVRSAEQVVMTASTSEAYSLLFSLLCEPGDNVLAPSPCYPLFDMLAAHHRIELRPYQLDEERQWRIDPNSLQADQRTRAILVVCPHNPTGAVVTETLPTLEQLGLPVICDEVFSEFTWVGAVPLLGALHPALPIFYLHGISKLFALPDLKLSWVAMNALAARAYGERLEFLNDTFLSASSFVQQALPAFFSQGWGFVQEMRAQVKKRIDLALRALANMPQLQTNPPQGGYLLFPKVLCPIEEETLTLRLIERGVLVHPGYFYGAEKGQHIMLSCLLEEEKLSRGLEILTQFFRDSF